MYSLYRRTKTATGFRYEFVERISLFGCNKGFIPNLLQCFLTEGQNEPCFWNLNINEHFGSDSDSNNVPVINLKPRSSEPNLSLYEIVNVFGHSHNGWTPILLHIRGLLVDEDPQFNNENDFERDLSEIDDPIFTLLYLRGSISDGKITGRWTTPSASPTNSVLLWPETFRYFMKEASEIIAKTEESDLLNPIACS